MARLGRISLSIMLIGALIVGMSCGMQNAVAVESGDPGFEDGTLDGWTIISAPDGVSVTGPDTYASPYWGDYMVALGTPPMGPPWAQLPGPNAIAKDFLVTTPSMAFAYNVFTVDYPSWDRFAYTVTLSCAGRIIAQWSTTAFGVAPGGTVVSTGWQVVDLDVSLYRGRVLTVQVEAGGTRDSILATWAYFDVKPLVPMVGDMMGPVIHLPGLEKAGGASASDSSADRAYTLVTDVYDDSGWATVGIIQNGATVTGGTGTGWQSFDLHLGEGMNDIVVVASDAYGHTTTRSLAVYVDSTAPEVTLDEVPDTTTRASVSVGGVVTGGASGLSSITVNGTEVPVAADGTFSCTVPLSIGANAIIVATADTHGNTASWTIETHRIAGGTTTALAVNGSMTTGDTLGMLEGTSFELGAAPFVARGAFMVPVRSLVEALGGSVRWSASARVADIFLGEHTVSIAAGGTLAQADGRTVPVDELDPGIAAELEGGKLFAPAGFLAQYCGLDLHWSADAQTLAFTYWP